MVQSICEKKSIWQNAIFQTDDHYVVTYDNQTAMVEFRDFLELSTAKAYAVVNNLNHQIQQQKLDAITLDLRMLQISTAPGIIMVAKFIINVRNQKISSFTILGSHTIAWHAQTLNKLKQLLPTLTLIID